MGDAAHTVVGFLPSVNGFRFTNRFPSAPTIRVDLGPVGRVGLGNASQGVCGGMTYAVRDFFEAGRAVPTVEQPPVPGTPLFDYIATRLIDSFGGVEGVSRYLRWMLMPDRDLHLVVGSRPGTFAMTVGTSWPAVRADIDADHPSPLGLVTVHTADIRQIGRCHQGLAYGYHVDAAGTVTLRVYDPNTPHAAADDVWIRFSAAQPHVVSPITHNIKVAAPTLHGFFRSRYRATMPPPTLG